MISVVDYGMGNLGSILNMLRKLGLDGSSADDPDVIADADRVILPGVGAFLQAMENLRGRGLVDALNHVVVDRGRPILGICLGMQLLTEGSEEGDAEGLGWVEARTVRFHFSEREERLVLPHMGWNLVEVARRGSILDGFEQDPRFYFVHSYHVRCRNEGDVVGRTTYGYSFHSALQVGNVCGTQFHPEKSHRFGLKVLENFARLEGTCSALG